MTSELFRQSGRRSASMPGLSGPAWMLLALGSHLLCHAMPIRAADSPPLEPDWAAVDSDLLAGDYRQAVEKAADIAVLVKPRNRDPEIISRTVAFARAQTYRGLAERLSGDLDAAEATLEQGVRAFKDREFKRLVDLELRRSGAAAIPKLVPLELAWIQLLELRISIPIQRLELAAEAGTSSRGVKAGLSEDDLRTQVERWLKEIKGREAMVAEARAALVGRFEKAAPGILSSPFHQALAGDFFPLLAAARVSLAASRLPVDVPRSTPESKPAAADPDPAVSKDPRSLHVRDARGFLDRAGKALDDAIAAARPRMPEERTEADLLRAELLAGRAAAFLQAGDLASAQAAIDQSLELRAGTLVQRRAPRPETHPELLAPLLLAADIALAASREKMAGKDVPGARARAVAAAAILDRAERVVLAGTKAFPDAHPLRVRRAALAADLERQFSASSDLVPRSDAADAAARRARNGIEASPWSAGAAF